MRNILLVLFLLSQTILLNAQSPVEKYSKVRISLEKKSLGDLMQSGLEFDHGKMIGAKAYETECSSSDLARLRTMHIDYEVLIDDVVQHFHEMNANPSAIKERTSASTGCTAAATTSYPVPSHWRLGSMGGYFTYTDMLAILDTMRMLYPSLISARTLVSDTLVSIEGRQVYQYKIGDRPDTFEAAEPVILFTALHHAREPLSMSQMIMYMWYLLENYNTDPHVKNIVDHTQQYFIPCVNPDGYIYNQTTNPTGGGMWRKNRRNNGSTMGVDLNRNYSFFWGVDNVGSSPTPSSDTYRGTRAFSEPETRMVREFSLRYHPKISIHTHTYGNDLIYPWGHVNAHTPDSVTFIAMAKYITKDNGYKYGTGFETVGYVTNGDSDDWGYGDSVSKPKIYSMTPECGDAFWMPSAQITATCQNMISHNRNAAMLLVDNALLQNLTEPLFTSASGYLRFSIQRIGLNPTDTFTVRAYPVSSGFASLGSAVSFTGLNYMQSKIDSFAFTLNMSAVTGNRVSYAYELSHAGSVIERDTFSSNVLDSSRVLFYESGSTIASKWVNTGPSLWGTSTSMYYSPSSSITESVAGNTANNTNYRLESIDAMDLTAARSAYLDFYTKWDIERDFDYAEVSAAELGTATWIPLCGRYTNTGTANQDPGQPIYDGTQRDWVHETMDLSDFLGKRIKIRFAVFTDNFTTYDGFYFDELKVLVKGDTTSRVDTSAAGIGSLNDVLTLHVYPNPADQELQLFVSPASGEHFMLNVHDLSGKLVYTTPFDPQSIRSVYSLPTATLADGMYVLSLSGKKNNYRTRFIVQHP